MSTPSPPTPNERFDSTIKADAESIKETSEEPDQLSKNALEELRKEEYKAHIVGLKQDIEARKTYAGRIFWFLVTWSIVLGEIVVMCGIGWLDLSSNCQMLCIEPCLRLRA